MKIGKALGIGTGTVQRVLMEQPRPFDVDAAEAALCALALGLRKLNKPASPWPRLACGS